MVKSISLQMLVLIPANDFVPNYELNFKQWLPESEKDTIVIIENSLTFKLIIDRECAPYFMKVAELGLPGFSNLEVSQWLSIAVNKIKVEIELDQISDELADTVKKVSQNLPVANREVLQDYFELSKQIFISVGTRVNRIISFFRNQKGHFWLQEYPVTDQRLGEFLDFWQTKVKLENGQWVKWLNLQEAYPTRARSSEHGRELSSEEWPRLKEFVQDISSRPPLVPEILSNAEALAAQGHKRSALAEVVTALERAVASFGKNANMNKLFGRIMAERMGTARLEKQIEHLGLTGTVNYLFPVIFTEEQIPLDLLKACQQALDDRHKIVHLGQRELDESKVSSYLVAVRKLCEILYDFQQVKEQSPKVNEEPD